MKLHFGVFICLACVATLSVSALSQSQTPNPSATAQTEPIAQSATEPPVRRLKPSEPPRFVSRVPPHYPESAKAKHIEGTVRLNTVIGVKGTVVETKYLSGPSELVQAAIDAVKKWKFEPTLLNGSPVEVECVFELNFTLGR